MASASSASFSSSSARAFLLAAAELRLVAAPPVAPTSAPPAATLPLPRSLGFFARRFSEGSVSPSGSSLAQLRTTILYAAAKPPKMARTSATKPPMLVKL
eukprot:Amastigsp_a177058_13.p3 type:complete len:100 gc:universal Amastigsp_a177058_13:43-342(+)